VTTLTAREPAAQRRGASWIMLELNDPRWDQLAGGRRTQFDPRQALRQLASGVAVERAWAELWDGLHHQGNVDTAAYAAVPHLVRIHRQRDVPDWNTYAILGAIEREHHARRNPAIPAWLASGYQSAWHEIIGLALHDLERSEHPRLVQSALGVIAMARGLRRTAEVLLDFTEDELEEMVREYRGETEQPGT
jgi:hypothetical protein